MNATSLEQPAVAVPTVSERLRFWGATLVIWCLFTFGVGAWAFPLPSVEPLLVASGPQGILGSIAFLGATAIGAALAVIIVGAARPVLAIRALFLGIAIWTFRSATIDTWLHAKMPVPGVAPASPYWSLLSEYVVALVAVLVSVRVIDALLKRDNEANVAARRDSIFARIGTLPNGESFGALGIATVVALIIVHLAMGDPISETLFKQSFFAVIVGMWLAVLAARMVFAKVSLGSFWALPFLVGIIGVVVAGVAPQLAIPEAYRDMNAFAAWGVVRPLPIQIVFVGLTTILWLAPPDAARQSTVGMEEQN